MFQRLVLNHFEMCCYIVYDRPGGSCAIVDPGAKTATEDQLVADAVAQFQLTPVRILLTHLHLDHCAGLRQACTTYNLPVSLHPDAVEMLAQAEVYSSLMGFDCSNLDDLPRQLLRQGDTVQVGSLALEVRHVPGHCPGSLCFVDHAGKMVFTGDALFHLSIGRTDLPGGSHQLLVDSIRSQLLSLPDDYEVFPGHGMATNIGKERKHNPLL